MNRQIGSLFAAACVAAWASASLAQQIPTRAQLNTILGGNQILEDFESFNVASGSAVNLNVFVLDSTTIANSQGPGLVEPCARYVDPSSVQLQWNGANYFSLPTKTLMGNGSIPMFEIEYPAPGVHAMGVDVYGFAGFGYSGAVAFFDVNGGFLGSFPITVPGGNAPVFVGWQHNAPVGIGKVQIRGSNGWSWSPIVDDHGYGRTGGSLRVTGTCPGPITVSWAGATPSRPMRILFCNTTGNCVVPTGPCQGTQLGLGPCGGVISVFTGNTGPLGSGNLNANAGPAACLRWLQMIVVEPPNNCPACSTTNVAQIP
ncbi:MAG: hypothetical protein KJZ69_10110 [Phycisphaerales bacterium]|nr:hypothetical protein [Phycisphaerales bacterium]